MLERWNGWPLPRRLFFAELIGTALLLLVGLSFVILMSGAGSPVTRLVENEGLRQTITGFLFGCTGALIAVSVVGKHSGAHLNPVVTLAFWLAQKIETRVAVVYVVAQLAGAVLGSVPLLLWGSLGRSVAFGATLPGAGYASGTVVLGEVVTTAVLITGLCVFLAFRQLRRFTPAMFPFLYAVMVPLESAISGTSTNPARSLGPAVVAGEWQGWWIYWIGPILGTLVALAIFRVLAQRIEVAKLYHFDGDPEHVFRRWVARSATVSKATSSS